MDGILFGLDIGTTKVCALVGEVRDAQLQVIGVGIAGAQGMRRGMISNVGEASVAIAEAIEKAEQSSGYELKQGLVSMAGEHLESFNNQGSVPIRTNGKGVGAEDVQRVLEAAQNEFVPVDRQIVHLVPRYYSIGTQQDVVTPIGMHGNKLSVEAHIVTASRPALKNLRQCVQSVGIEAEELVLNALASGESVLEPTEREMGVIIADIGGGTTDIALYTGGSVWHTDVIPLGGYHITNDVAIGLRVPFDIAEAIKIKHGDCRPNEIDADNIFEVKPFSGEKIAVGWQDLAFVIEARVEELFEMILQSVKDSGYDGLLPAGIVLTGGSAQLRGITTVAERILNVSARVASPRDLVGLVDALQGPAYATSTGLLRWAMTGQHTYRPKEVEPAPPISRKLRGFIKLFLPDDE